MATRKRPRIRRSAEDARELILDAAEAQLVEKGPDSLRLVQLAAEVGMSHPAILHHFGSRDGLVRAVVERTARRLEAEVFASLRGMPDEDNAVALMERLFRALADDGHARLLVWIYLTGRGARDPVGYGERMKSIADAVHGIRRGRGVAADPEDTLFTVLLAGIALFGNAICGAPLRKSAGLGDEAASGARFLAWFARLLREHLERPAPPADQRTNGTSARRRGG